MRVEMCDDERWLAKDSKDVYVQDEVKEREDVRIYERRRRHGNGKERALGSFGTCMMRACGVPTFRLHGTETLGKIGLGVGSFQSSRCRRQWQYVQVA